MFRISNAFALLLGALLLGSGALSFSFASFAPAPAQARQTAAVRYADDGEEVRRTTPESVLNDSFVRVEAKRGLNLLYNMHFRQARTVFARIDRRYPGHPIGPFLLALNTWWQILLDLDHTSHDDAFYAAMDEVIERADRMLEEDPDSFDAVFFKGAALGFRGRLRSNRRQWLRAAYDGKRAMDYVLEVAEAAPENDDFAFGKGIYDYYAAVIPERYPWSAPFMAFFPEGDRERGLRLLTRAAEEGWYIQTEAHYFLLQIYYLYEQDFSEALKHAEWLRRKHPRNPYFHNFEGRVYARWGRWRRALPIFEASLARYEAGASGYNDAMAEQALYYLGRCRLMADDYRTALNYLARLEKMTADDEDSYYRVLGRLRQGMIYDALGRRQIAKSRYESVLEMEDHAGAHDRAERYLETPYGG